MKAKTILVAFGIVALLASTHCTSTYAKYCENQRNCSGGNDKDVDACIEGQRAAEEISEAYDCADQFDAYAECLGNAPCKEKRLDTSACSALQTAYAACRSAASGRTATVTSSTSSSGSVDASVAD